jgi:hypothetical protein
VQPTNTRPHQRAQRSKEWFSGEHSKMLVHVYIGQRVLWLARAWP